MRGLFCLILVPLMLPGTSEAEDEKLVLAHYMTDMVPRTDRPLNRWIDPELADPQGSTAALGGLNQAVPMASLYLKEADLTKAVDFEIRAARQLGVDGFQFYYPLVDNTPALAKTYNRIIGEFVRLSDARYPGFKVSLCLSHPHTREPTSEAERIKLWSPPIRSLLEETKDSPAWLRSRSGALLFYLWVGDSLAEGVKGRANTPDQIQKVGRAYQRLSRAIGAPIETIYQVRRPEIDPPYVDAIVKTFPAVWGWTASEEHPEFWDYLAKRCREEGCVYTQTVYPDYYTSKVYRKGGDHTILSTDQALAAGLAGIERHYRVTNLAQTQIQLLKRAVDRDVAIINYVTWNDFPEGHHLAPEVNHNFGPAVLLGHFKREWKSGERIAERDEAVVFFKKSRHDVQPEYSVSLKIKSENQDLAGEDRIELVTLLTEPAECYLNDKSLGMVGRGLQVSSIPSEPGRVRVRVVRDGREVLRFETPEAITNTPLRTDRLTYSYSSTFDREFARLFGAEN
ncbi:MAG: hypothetical protein HQ582_18780 [Planctomycetes bacterium]|nr:hypothetical protein [Planctomycetota bacterium]